MKFGPSAVARYKAYSRRIRRLVIHALHEIRRDPFPSAANPYITRLTRTEFDNAYAWSDDGPAGTIFYRVFGSSQLVEEIVVVVDLIDPPRVMRLIDVV